MLIQLQFPLWDTRRISRGAEGLLPSPGWPAPAPERSFIHTMGMIRKRPLGGITGWVGEDAYCELSTWFRIPRRMVADLGPAKSVPIRHLFSRFYFDGTLSGKIDIGFFISNSLLTSIVRAGSRTENGATKGRISTHLGAITEIAVGLLDLRGTLIKTGEQDRIGNLPGRFLDTLCAVTSRREFRTPVGQATLREYMVMGPPTLGTESAGPLSKYLALESAASAPPGSGSASVALSRSRKPTSLPVWHIFSRDFDETGNDRRLLRIALLRLSSDLYCLRRLIADLGRGRIDIEPGSVGSDVLQEYIRNVCKRLRTDIRAVQQTEAGTLAGPIFQRLFEPGAVDAAFSRLLLIDMKPETRDLLRETIDEIVDRGDKKDVITLGPGAVFVQGVVHGDVTTNVSIGGAG